MNFQAISMNEVEQYMNIPNTWLIDLRSREDYNLFHIDGARNIPYEELERYKNQMPKKNSYILYCERGGSSLLAAKQLSREGYQVYTVIGGIRAWEERYLN